MVCDEMQSDAIREIVKDSVFFTEKGNFIAIFFELNFNKFLCKKITKKNDFFICSIQCST